MIHPSIALDGVHASHMGHCVFALANVLADATRTFADMASDVLESLGEEALALANGAATLSHLPLRCARLGR